MKSIWKTNYICLSSRKFFCIVENENVIFDQRYMWNTLTIVGSCINLASGKLFVLSWRKNDKKVYVFGITGKRGLKQKDTIQNSIYKKISIYFFLQENFYIQLNAGTGNHSQSWYCFLRNRRCILMFRVLTSSCVVIFVSEESDILHKRKD